MRRREEVTGSLEASASGNLNHPEVVKALEKYSVKNAMSQERIETAARDLMKKRTSTKILVAQGKVFDLGETEEWARPFTEEE